MKMSEQTVVVAGGGGGIGAAIARAFAKAGCAVAVCDARLDAAEATALDIQSENGRGQAWKMDVTDRAGVERATDDIERQLGAIETWVNAAGISKIVPFLDCTEQTWDQILDGEPQGRFPRLPGGHPADAAAQARRHRQPLLAVRQGRQHAVMPRTAPASSASSA